ncbi:hypothetical protein [Lentzea sp. NPDC092896]|uniref:CdiA C-terminal domain-containing protein n=1 Tax=Lentzea sp. NPDC092896 TaxID=3364127 RepID=UPI0037F280EC
MPVVGTAGEGIAGAVEMAGMLVGVALTVVGAPLVAAQAVMAAAKWAARIVQIIKRLLRAFEKLKPLPDYRIEGQIFDNVAPTTNNPRNVADRILRKVEAGQTERVVVKLADSGVSPDALRDWPIERLKEAIVIDKNGNVLHIYP